MRQFFKITLSDGSQEDNNIIKTINISVSRSVYHLIFILIISALTQIFPMLWLIFFMPLTILSLVLGGIPYYIQPYFPRVNLILPILEILGELNILKFFITLHSLVFYSITKIYLYFFVFCNVFTILYMIVSRYNFYHKVVLREDFSFDTSLVIGLLLFISFCGSYLRILINVSNVVVAVVRHYAPDLLDPLLRVQPEELPPGSHRSLFHFSRNTHNNHYPPQPKSVTWGRAGFFIACGGMVLGGVTAYYTARQTYAMERQTLEMIHQNDLMERQTLEIIHQNDLEELSQGIMTKEEFNKRYPKK